MARAWTDPPAAWEALVRDDPNATPAHRPAVWQALATALPGMTPLFCGVDSDGVFAGGAGALIERRAGFRWIHALPFLLPGAPLARPGHHATVDAAVGAHFGALQRELGAVGGEWMLYRPAGPAVDDAARSALSGATRMHDSWTVDVTPGAAARWRMLEKNTRHALRRAWARGLQVIEDPGGLEGAYAMHLAQARDWPGFRPLPIELSRRLLGAVDASGPVARLFVVRDGRRRLAALFLLEHPRERFAWWSGMSEAGRAAGAMPVLFWSLIERAAGEGRVRLNLGGGTGRETLALFKRRFGAEARRDPVVWLDARRAPWPGRTVGALQAWWRRGRARGEAT